ncbi:unnamed protein product [Rhodiola kirilowii]
MSISQTDWDLRLASLLLLAFDQEENFWQLYGDFLPSADECTSLLLASQDDLSELQDQNLASTMREQRRRALEFWERNWHSAVPLKIKRLARDPERFIWAVAIAQSRCINMQMRVGSLVQDANLLIPYAGDILLYLIRGTIGYLQRNPWDVIQFSGNARIHLESFLSIFNISGLPEEYYYNSCLSGGGGGSFVDGAVLAAARTIPTWSDKDLPPIPSQEQSAVKELQGQCQQMLAEYPTTSEQDHEILESMPESRRTFYQVMWNHGSYCSKYSLTVCNCYNLQKNLLNMHRYRLHRKLLLEKIIKALEIYQERLLF